MLKGKKVKAVQILLLKLRLRINNTYLCVLSMFFFFLDSSLLESMTWITKFPPPHFLSFEQICERMSQGKRNQKC